MRDLGDGLKCIIVQSMKGKAPRPLPAPGEADPPPPASKGLGGAVRAHEDVNGADNDQGGM